MPLGPTSGDSISARTSSPSESREFGNAIDRRALDGRVPDNAVWHIGGRGLELRLHQRDDLALGRQRGKTAANDAGQGNERDVDDGEADRLRQRDMVSGGRFKPGCVRALHRDDARVPAQSLGKLSTPHVESIDACRAALQKRVREAARRRAHVQADAPVDVDRECDQRRVQFLAAARHETRRSGQLDANFRSDELARFAIDPAAVTLADAHLAGHQEPRGLLPVSGHAARHDQIIEANATGQAVLAFGVRRGRLAAS